MKFGVLPATGAGQPMLGGVNGPLYGKDRPVQTPFEVQSSDSGFGFLSKTNKQSAFDFVKDEMKSATTSK